MNVRRMLMAIIWSVGVLLLANGLTATRAEAAEPNLTGFWKVELGYGLLTTDEQLPTSPPGYPLYIHIQMTDLPSGTFTWWYVDQVRGCPIVHSTWSDIRTGRIVLPRRAGDEVRPLMRPVFTMTQDTSDLGGADPWYYAAYAGNARDTRNAFGLVDPLRPVVTEIYGTFWQATTSAPDRGMFKLTPYKPVSPGSCQ